MNVLLTHGYFINDDPKEQKIMRPYPPLGILYISAFLDQNGVENEVFDTTFSGKQALEGYLLSHRPEVLAIYVNLMTKLNVIEIVGLVKESPQLSNTKIILGGPDVRYNLENYLDQGADFVVIGEGEETTLELVLALENKESEKYHQVDGIAFKDNDGKVIITSERTKVKNIDELPSPNRHKIDLSKYLRAWKDFHGQSAISVSTMRGCPYTCKWCSRGVYGLSYRRRSAEKVVAELKQIKETYNPDTLWFVDDVFTISHKWLKEFNEVIKKEKIKIPYECITRADRLSEEVIAILKESGCFRVWIGAESGSQKVVDLMDRRVKVEQVREMIKLSRKYGIQAGTFIMVGYPGETEEDIEETIHHLKDSNPDHFTITVAYPIKGTELYTEVEALQVTSPTWKSSTDREIDFKRTYSRKYYDFAVMHITNEVYYHKNKLANGLNVANSKMKIKSIVAKMGMWWERRSL